MPIVYTYSGCGTCRTAMRFVREHAHVVEERPIRERPPSLGELRRMLAASGGEVRRLFNTSGQDYRALGLKDLLPGMASDEALRLLAGNGNLIRRPFLIDGNRGLVGFDAAAWSAFFAR